MPYLVSKSVPVVTNAGGAGSADIPCEYGGRILSASYVKAGATPYANGVGVAITVLETGESILALASGAANMDASVTKKPRVPTHDALGVAALLAPLGSPALEPVVLAAGQSIHVVVDAGGNTKTGTFVFVLG